MAAIKAFVLRTRKITWLNWAAAAGAVLVLPLCYQCLTEYIRIRNFRFFLEYVWVHRSALLPAYVILAAVAAAITFATARPWITSLAMGLSLFALGTANYYKLTFRGTPLLPKDFVQVSEAVAISKELELSVTEEIWRTLLVILVMTLLLLPFRVPLGKGRGQLALRVAIPVFCCAAIPVYLFSYIGNKTLMEERHGVAVKPLLMAETYYQSTFVTGFFYQLVSLWQEKPEGYSQQTLEGLASQVAAAEDAANPDIIVVMLESVYDLRTIENTAYSEALLPNYERLQEEGVSGQVLSDKRDGGTSDYEYQLLTGFTTSFMPAGSVPLIEYVEEGLPSLPGYLEQKGYRTVAVHPYLRSFYSRPVAYSSMRIQEFYAEEDFDDGLTVGAYISDDALADRIIGEYGKSMAGDERVFIHAVSMQNHMPFSAGVYPEGYRVEAVSGFGAEYDGILSTYATGVRDADAMMGRLCDYFREIDRDVVLIFFGDHQSSVADEGMVDLAMLTQAYQEAPEQDQWKMTHTTPYLIWANYKQEPVDGGLVAPYMLVPLMAENYGVEVPAWFTWLGRQLAVSGGVSGGYYIQPDETILDAPAAQQKEMFHEQRLFQYDLLFGEQYSHHWMYAEG